MPLKSLNSVQHCLKETFPGSFDLVLWCYSSAKTLPHTLSYSVTITNVHAGLKLPAAFYYFGQLFLSFFITINHFSTFTLENGLVYCSFITCVFVRPLSLLHTSFLFWLFFLSSSRRCHCRMYERKSSSVKRLSCRSLEWWRTWADLSAPNARSLTQIYRHSHSIKTLTNARLPQQHCKY